MFERKKIKETTKVALKGNWSKMCLYLICVSLVSVVATFLIEMIFGWSIELTQILSLALMVFITYPLSVGVYNVYLFILRGEKVSLKDLGFAFSDRYPVIFTHGIVKVIKIFLWTLLLIVPGIIKAFEYSFTERILIDNPQMSSKEAFIKSREMTNGHKMHLFVLGLSFVLWYLLYMVILFVFAFIWTIIAGVIITLSGSFVIIVILVVFIVVGVTLLSIPLNIYVQGTFSAAYLHIKGETEMNIDYTL